MDFNKAQELNEMLYKWLYVVCFRLKGALNRHWLIKSTSYSIALIFRRHFVLSNFNETTMFRMLFISGHFMFWLLSYLDSIYPLRIKNIYKYFSKISNETNSTVFYSLRASSFVRICNTTSKNISTYITSGVLLYKSPSSYEA